MMYIVNGKPRTGKDQFANYVIKLIGPEYAMCVSSIDPIKEIAIKAGWTGEKTVADRKHLSELKSYFTRWLDTPFEYVKKEYDIFCRKCSNYDIDITRTAFFVMVREPEEIARYKEVYGAKAILVKRDEMDDIIYSNESDNDVNFFDYDIEIKNNGTKADLVKTAIGFINIENLGSPAKNFTDIKIDDII